MEKYKLRFEPWGLLLFLAIDRKNMIAMIPISIFTICHLIYALFNYIV